MEPSRGGDTNRSFSNAVYGVLDYAAYPAGMLVLAPFILHNLGVAQYGIWAVTSSVVSLASIIASGFGDAIIQKVAHNRATEFTPSVLPAVRAGMGIHIVLGVGLGIAVFASAGILGARVCQNEPHLAGICAACIRFAAFVIAIRAVETVCISTQRAYERYGAAVRTSIAARMLSLASAAVVSYLHGDIGSIMAITAGISFVALLFQLIGLQRLLRTNQIGPSFTSAATAELLHLGVLTWMIAAAGVLFSYADRLVGGATMGAAAVASYALCAQVSQPVYGLTAAGLHFLFPYLARTEGSRGRTRRNRILRLAFLANVVFVSASAGLLLVLRHAILRFLSGDVLAQTCDPLLPPVLAGSALLGLSVTGTYGLLALGRAGAVAVLNVIASIAAVAVVSLSTSRGVMTIVAARVTFAAVALLVYLPLLRNTWINVVPQRGSTRLPVAAEEA